MEIVLRKLRAPRIICIGSIAWFVAAFIAGFAFSERRLQIIGFMLGFFGMPLTLVTPLPMIFVPAPADPNYYISLSLIAAGFLIQWQLIAFVLHRLLRREDRLFQHTKDSHEGRGKA